MDIEIDLQGGKYFDPSWQRFEANGKKYRIINFLPLGRGIQLDIYNIELRCGLTLFSLNQQVRSAYEDLNKVRNADCAVKLRDVIDASAMPLTDNPSFLKICALYMCYEGEDINADLTDDLINEKIEDWKIEGYTKDSFLEVAVIFANGMKGK